MSWRSSFYLGLEYRMNVNASRSAVLSRARANAPKNTETIIKSLRGIISEPLYQHLISPAAIGKLKSVINQPYTPNSTFRTRANNLATYFANASKAFHSGKGDDFESVAVVYGNPALPISLSDAGLVSNTPPKTNGTSARIQVTNDNTGKTVVMDCNYELWKAMSTYGGHYITVNLDISDLLSAAKKGDRAAARLAAAGKGKTRVQIDYLGLIPPGPGQPFWKVFILELKAGKTHLEMDPTEEEQMAKAEWVFKKWLGPNTQVELLYHPFLVDDLSFARNWSEKHASSKVTYLTLNGLCQFLKLDPTLVKQIGSMRAQYHGNMGLFEGTLSKVLFGTRNNIIAQRRLNAQALHETVEDALEKTIKNSPILSGSAQAILASRGTSVQNVFGGKLGSGVNPNTNADWKSAIQYIAYLILQKEQLRRNLNVANADTATIIQEMYKISAQILKINSNRGGKILQQTARNQLSSFVANTGSIYKNITSVDAELKTDYLENYIELRAKMLGRRNYTLANVNNAGKLRHPTAPEVAAASKVALANWKSFAKVGNNKGYIKRFQSLKNNRGLNHPTRGNIAAKYSNSLKNTYGSNSTLIRSNAERAILKSTNEANARRLVNNAKSLFEEQRAELNNILAYLATWATNPRVLGSIPEDKRGFIQKKVTDILSKLNTNSGILNSTVARKFAPRANAAAKKRLAITPAEEAEAKRIAAQNIAGLVGPARRMNVGGGALFGN